MFGKIPAQQLFSQQSIMDKLTYGTTVESPAVPAAAMNWTPWLIGGVLLGGGLYLLFRDKGALS